MTAKRVTLAFVLVIAVSYGAAPWLAARLLPPVLARWGIEQSQFEFGYPRWDGVDIAQFSLRSGGAFLVANRVRVAYGLTQLLLGEVDSVVIDALTVQLERGGGYDGGGQSLELPPIWSLIPAQRVSVVKLDITSADPIVAAHGSVNFDPDVLQLDLDVASPLLAVPLLVHGAVNSDGRVAIKLLEQGAAETLASLVGVPDADHRAMTVDVRVALSGRPLAFAAAYAQTTIESGDVVVEGRGRAAWPLPAQAPWKALTLDGRYKVELVASTASISRAQARFDGDFSVADDTLKAHIDPGGALQVDVPALHDLWPRTQRSERVSVANDQTIEVEYSPKELRLGDGLVVTAGAPSNPIQFRLRGALGADNHFELGIVSLDGAPIFLATGKPDGAQNLTIKSRFALAGRVLRASGASMGLVTTGGRVFADFEGAVHWPPVPERGLQNVAGKGRAELALTGRFAPERSFDIALEGGYTIGDGSIKAAIDSGAHMVLPADGLEVSTISALDIDARPDREHVDVGPVDFKLALPPMHLGVHAFTLGDAWVALEQVTLDGNAVTATAVVRSHSSRDALPLRMTASHDLALRAGQFVIAGDWQIKKAILVTQLPGFQAPYDIDEGTLAVTLTGGWDMSKDLSYHGSGSARVAARRAHYEDYVITGMAGDLPVSFDAQGYAVAPTPITIEQIDVGFPLSGVGVGVAVADGVARLRDLGGSVLGGRFSINEFGYDIALDKAAFDVALEHLSLADVLALEGGDVQGSGVLDGKLPVVIDGEKFIVDRGSVSARPPGGTLVYKGAAASSMVAQSGFGFAFKALEDFRYDTLDANVGLAADGALALAVRLRGANPAVEQGRAIAFNLNLTENLPALLESLRAAQRITNQVEQRFTP